MSLDAFEVALGRQDNDASHFQLRQLIDTQNFSKTPPPATAGVYLRAFCDITTSPIRRRWIGIALAQMIEASSDAEDHLKQLHLEFQQLGTIILNNMEREETKIIAGIIIRQALQRGVQDSYFWASDKIKNSAPDFPKKSGPRWMAEFQSFLDTLNEVALATPIADPSIIYAISIVASDNFRWRDSTEELLIAIIQAEVMTVIAPSDGIRGYQFVDIPLTHICSVQLVKSMLHDSQAQDNSHEPWSLSMKLKNTPWTYRLNTYDRTGSEVTLLFQHFRDAEEWKTCIKDHQEREDASCTDVLKAQPMMSASSPINVGPSPANPIDGTATQRKQQVMVQSRSSVLNSGSRLAGVNEDTMDVEQPTLLHASPLREQNLLQTGTLSGEPGEAALSRQAGVPNSVANAEKQPQEEKDNEGEEENFVLQYHNAGSGSSTVYGKRGKAKGAGRAIEPGRNVTFSKPLTTLHSDKAVALNSPPEQTKSGPHTSQTAMSSKGKLKKVSRPTKMKVSQQLCAPSDFIDDSERSPDSEMSANVSNTSSLKRTTQTPSGRKNDSAHKTKGFGKSSKPRSKRKREDEEEYVPAQKKSKKRQNGKRQNISSARKDHLNLGSNPRTELKKDSMSNSGAVETSEDKRVPNPQQHKPTRPEDHARTPPQRRSLIEGLLNSQQLVKTSSIPSKGSKLSSQTCQTHSAAAGTKGQSIQTFPAPKTPAAVQWDQKEDIQPHLCSSPPPGTRVRGAMAERHSKEPEILSSNSKPLPASPSAESTAISGHADRKDMDLEKRKGESKLALSNPFQEHRGSQRPTHFVRRLTGETSMNQDQSHKETQSRDMSDEFAPWDISETDEVFLAAAIAPGFNDLPQQLTKNSHVETKGPVKTSLTVVKHFSSSMMKATTEQQNAIGCQGELHVSQGVEENRAVQPAKRRVVPEATSGNTSGKEYAPNAVEQLVKEIVPARVASLPRVEGECQRSNKTIFTAAEHGIYDTRIKEPILDEKSVQIDGDMTLVDHFEDDGPATRNNPSLPKLRFVQSNSRSPGSHSSVSKASTSSFQSQQPTSEAEEMEWEANLQPHQRTLHDLLIRTSKRVMRHIVDNDTAVTSIADSFAEDGESVLHEFLQQYIGDSDRFLQDMESKTKCLMKELESGARKLANERRRVSDTV